MAKNEQPAQQPTPDPRSTDITDEVASDLMSDSMKRRKGRKASFLTSGQRSNTNTNSLLGNNNNILGSK